MASAWGKAWGKAWGNAWGVLDAVTVSDGRAGESRLAASGLLLVDPDERRTPVAPFGQPGVVPRETPDSAVADAVRATDRVIARAKRKAAGKAGTGIEIPRREVAATAVAPAAQMVSEDDSDEAAIALAVALLMME